MPAWLKADLVLLPTGRCRRVSVFNSRRSKSKHALIYRSTSMGCNVWRIWSISRKFDRQLYQRLTRPAPSWNRIGSEPGPIKRPFCACQQKPVPSSNQSGSLEQDLPISRKYMVFLWPILSNDGWVLWKGNQTLCASSVAHTNNKRMIGLYLQVINPLRVYTGSWKILTCSYPWH